MDEDRIWNTISIDRATSSSSARLAEQKIIYTSDETMNKRDESINEGGRHTTEEDEAEVLWEYAVDCIMCLVDESDDV